MRWQARTSDADASVGSQAGALVGHGGWQECCSTVVVALASSAFRRVRTESLFPLSSEADVVPWCCVAGSRPVLSLSLSL